MPGPPPPPPPGGPPPPMMPAFTPPKGGPDERSALLKSIQKGAKLKKAVTNDKSAPMIGKVSNVNSNSTSNITNSDTTGSRSGGVSAANGIPMGLGGLFAGGMPKLKSTGLRSESPSSSSNNSASNHNVIPRVGAVPSASNNQRFNNIQSELKKQMLNNDNRTRGPPPPAPVRHPNNAESHLHRNGNVGLVGGLSLPAPLTGTGMGVSPTPNHSSLHRNAQSHVNLSTWNDSRDDADSSGACRPAISHGKPNLAPRPPSQTNGKKLSNGKSTPSVNRAQSMRNSSNRQPSTPDSPNSGTVPSPAPKFGTVRYMPSATGALSHARSRPALNGRPTDPPPSIPTVAAVYPAVPQHSYHGTPPPPSRTQGNAAPAHGRLAHGVAQAPSVPPPPPPHLRTLRQPPPPPVPLVASLNSSVAAPPPPPRHSSMRDRPGGSCGSDFEARFQFHNTPEFPRPNNFKSLPKNYRGKSVGVKQPAPLPPAASMNYPLATNRAWDSTAS